MCSSAKKQAGKLTETNLLRYTLRVDRRYFQKFRSIAQAEGRSTNKKMEQYIKKYVDRYEEIHGEIEVNVPGAKETAPNQPFSF